MSSQFTKKLLFRIVTSFLSLLLLLNIIFFLIHLAPGEPSLIYLSPSLSEEMILKISKEFQLGGSILDQYINFITNILQGNFGNSFSFKTQVFDVIQEYIFFTIYFSIAVFLIQLILSILLVYLVLYKSFKKLEKLLNIVTMLLYSTPTFVIGILLIYVFSYKLGFFPISGIAYTQSSNNFISMIINIFLSLILPILTLTLFIFPLYYNYLKENMKINMKSSFSIYLYSLGKSPKQILIKHVLPNSVNPILAVSAIDLGILFGGSLITEVIFGLPGMGRLTYQAINNLDYPLIIGCCFVSGIMMIFTILLSDMIRIFIDKRLVGGLLN